MISPSIVLEACRKGIKAVEISMQTAVLREHQMEQLLAVNQHRKRKQKAVRSYIQSGGGLTGAEGKQKLVKLSNCGKQGIQTNDHGGHQHAVTAVNKAIIGLDALISNVFSYGIE